MNVDKVYLVHILECIGRIKEYTESGKRGFETDTRTQDAVVRNLQVLSESIGRISEPTKTQHPGLVWREIAAFRNVTVHDYLGIDLNQIWGIVEFDIPVLKVQINEILQSMGGSG